MKEKIKGKIFVGMIISLLAFGLATGASIFVGTNPLNSSGIMNLTQQGQFPSLPFSPNNATSNNQQTVNTTPTTTPTTNPQQTTTPSTPSNSNNSNKNTNSTSPTKTTNTSNGG